MCCCCRRTSLAAGGENDNYDDGGVGALPDDDDDDDSPKPLAAAAAEPVADIYIERPFVRIKTKEEAFIAADWKEWRREGCLSRFEREVISN